MSDKEIADFEQLEQLSEQIASICVKNNWTHIVHVNTIPGDLDFGQEEEAGETVPFIGMPEEISTLSYYNYSMAGLIGSLSLLMEEEEEEGEDGLGNDLFTAVEVLEESMIMEDDDLIDGSLN